jgi:hypothetical protein
MFIDRALIVALAIVPLSVQCSTWTFYWYAMYAFYIALKRSPSQLSVAMAACAVSDVDRFQCHTHIFGRHHGIFTAANPASWWAACSDAVGSHIWGPGYRDYSGDYETYRDAKSNFDAKAHW